MEKTSTSSSLKLNYKRTFLIGFAFFGILLLWQVYDSWCPTFLTEILKTKMPGTPSELDVQWIVGIIMACDNLAALILLPIFGRLSDKTKTPIGKRMPYILLGSMISAIAFPFIPLFFHMNNIAGMVVMMAVVLIFMMMYRNPAVSLMPDITPKPLRAKANGIINIMGYLGGACATVLGLFLVLTKYLKGPAPYLNNIWIIELPFIIASILIVASSLVLAFTIKENKLQEELKDELQRGEALAEIENPLEEDKPLSRKNRIMLFGILIAEFLWFMADNAVGTYLVNYVFYYCFAQSSAATLLIILGGVASVAGFATAGFLADKIGRKFTVVIGLGLSVIAYVLMFFVKPSGTDIDNLSSSLPIIMYIVWVVKGYGMALVHNCSFPMVVELSTGKTIGKFTGYYYAASMSAQTITPVLLGLIFKISGLWNVLPYYAGVLTTISFLVFFFMVKNIKAKKLDNAKGLEALGDD